MQIINFYRNINFEVNGLIIFLFALVLVLVTVIVLVIRKIVLALKTERKIDEHLRETRARISRAVTEIEDYKDTPECVIEKEVQCIQEVSEVSSKGKKTRAMSMEERWAEYEQKRFMRSTIKSGV